MNIWQHRHQLKFKSNKIHPSIYLSQLCVSRQQQGTNSKVSKDTGPQKLMDATIFRMKIQKMLIQYYNENKDEE